MNKRWSGPQTRARLRGATSDKNVTRGQRWAPATFGGWAPFPPRLSCRARLSYGKLHLPTWLLPTAAEVVR